MLGMHGAYEANHAMHDCDVMVASARASTTASPAGSTPSRRARRRSTSTSTRPRSTRSCKVDIGIVGDARPCARGHVAALARDGARPTRRRWPAGGVQIDGWRAQGASPTGLATRSSSRNTPSSGSTPLTKDRDVYITTEVGQHQMWAAQFFHFEEPNRWMTSGGLGTMGYGLPAAVGVQMAHPGAWSSTSPARPRCR